MVNNAEELFEDVVPFATVAEELGFRRAAERLRVTPAAVSRSVQRLEARLGVRLFDRTTRTVRLTAEGARFAARCREAVAQLRLARAEMSEARTAPEGTLVVSASPILARLVVPRLAPFASRHPAVTLDLRFTDRVVRFAEDDVEVALRVGAHADGDAVARELLATRWVTVASPAYLARHGTPRRPDDLGAHSCIRFVGPRREPRAWTFARGRSVSVSGPLVVDLGDVLVDAALADAGICQVLDFMVQAPLARGELVEILGEHAADGPPIAAVYPSARRALPRLRAFVTFLAAELPAGRIVGS